MICCFSRVQAQQTYTITFNESGQITSELPSLVTTDDKLQFVVVGTQDNYEKRVLAVYQRFLETIQNLDKNAKGVYTVLDNVGLDNKPQVNRQLLTAIEARMAKALKDWLEKDPAVSAIIDKKRNLGEDIIKFNKIIAANTLGDEDMKTLIIPAPDSMVDPKYLVEYGFTGSFSAKKLPCTTPLNLPGGKNDCHWIFTSAETNALPADIGFYRLTYKLRLNNNLYDVVNTQLKAITSLLAKARAINIDNEKAGLKRELDKLKLPVNSDAEKLFAWMDSRIKGQEDKTNLPHLTAIYDKKQPGADMADALITAMKQSIDKNMKDADVVKFMLLLSWVNKGANLTMNPLTSGLPTDIKGQLSSKNDELSDSTASLTTLNKKIDLYESMLKAPTQNCCKTPNYDTQLKSYNAMLDLQKKIVKAQAQLNKDIQGLKDQQTKNDKNQNDLKKSLLSDSLLYSGYLTVSRATDDVNHQGYHFMRHHDELNDYRHFDLWLQKEINEKQFIEAIAENHDPSKKILIKYTYTAVSSDVDFLGSHIPATVAGAPTVTLEDLYKIYSHINDIFIPYGNGVINLPLTPVTDDTPDYISKTNVAPDPDKPPQTGSYSFLDSASAKNLNLQGASFPFRINALYYFRLKAGIAYSTLSRRTYTVNTANNTASYTSAATGLAPVFGIQIFTRRIDIQRDDVFPTGGAPFIYAGYMYSDAALNNLLVGTGWEIISGFAVTGGVHFGKTQQLYTSGGTLQTRDAAKLGVFVSFSLGLEAFKAIFNSAKSIPNPTTK